MRITLAIQNINIRPKITANATKREAEALYRAIVAAQQSTQQTRAADFQAYKHGPPAERLQSSVEPAGMLILAKTIPRSFSSEP